MTTAKAGLKAAAPLAGIAVGLNTLVTQASEKTLGPSPSPSITFTSKLAYTVSRMIGPQLTAKLFTGQNLQIALPQAGTNPWGAMNSYTISGAVLLVANEIISGFIHGKYGYSYAKPFIVSIAGGLIGGGIVGGLFDPPPNGGPSSSYVNSLPSVNSEVNMDTRMTM